MWREKLLPDSNNKQYVNKPLTVVLDGGVTFTAKAVKDRKATYKGESYAVKPGARDIIVRSGNDVIYSKKLFLSPQETKQIKLP